MMRGSSWGPRRPLVATLMWTLSTLCFLNASAQPCVDRTGNNATVFFPRAAATTLQTGDVVRAWHGALCVGEMIFDEGEETMFITVWGDNTVTQAVDGMPPGVVISYNVHRPASGHTVDAVTVSYTSGNGTYAPDAILYVASFEVNGDLPVELILFDSTVKGSNVVLEWQTATETNNAGFSIEQQSERGARWEEIAFVEGHGTTSELQAYRHRVEGLAPGPHTFRLKQIDFDGAFAYSPEIAAFVELPEQYQLSDLYPNPFNPQASLTLTLQQTEDVIVQLYDLHGRFVQKVFAGRLQAGLPETIRIDAGSLVSGVYLLRVQGQSFQAIRKAVLLK